MDKNSCLKELEKYNFKKHLEKISKKYTNKKILIYGTGLVFQNITKEYDLSKLNIIGVSDRTFENSSQETCENYRAIKPSEIINEDIDIILVASLTSFKIIEYLEEDLLKDKKIEILPLIKKPFIELFKEVF